MCFLSLDFICLLSVTVSMCHIKRSIVTVLFLCTMSILFINSLKIVVFSLSIRNIKCILLF